ncbi:MAG: NUDIX hydrolase [Oscillospiraceae bacterium]|nr:NUDIX hydrolase [Oscillospiraceae bacterium]
MNHLYEETLNSELKYDGLILKVCHDTVRLEDNSVAGRDVVLHSGGVGVLPVTDDGNVILVKQFRYPQREVVLEIPAGKLEPGENPLECGKRELAEETGYFSHKIRELGMIFPTPAFCSEIIHIFLAEKIKSLPRRQGLDKDEFLDVIEMPFEEALRQVVAGEIKDAKTQIALLKAKLIL